MTVLTRAFAVCLAVLAALAAAACTAQTPQNGSRDAELRTVFGIVLEAASPDANSDEPAGANETAEDAIARFYRARDYVPLWVGPEGMTARGTMLLDRLAHADDDALDPSAYLVALPERTAMELGARYLAITEISLSQSLIRFDADLRGVESPDPGVLSRAADAADFGIFLDGLIPTDPAYKALRGALAHYRELRDTGGWPIVPSGLPMEAGAEGRRVEILRQRLAMTGDLDRGDGPASSMFDDSLAAGVKHFQARHGEDPDGVVGERTLAALNVPARLRVAQIEANLRILRGPDFRFGDHDIVVNIPAAEAQLIEDGRTVLRSRVIIGRRDWPTPSLHSRITAIELNPTWTVPKRIALLEIMPKIRKDGADYLLKRGFRVFDSKSREVGVRSVDWASLAAGRLPYILRQDPGPMNPLGRVKFVFENSHDVYLHDTPNRTLFERHDRTLSHGCVRVEEASALARRLLNQELGWDREEFDKAIQSAKTKRIRLRTAVPVHLVHLTAWVGENGEVHFRDDPYAPAQPRVIVQNTNSCPGDVEAIRKVGAGSENPSWDPCCPRRFPAT